MTAPDPAPVAAPPLARSGSVVPQPPSTAAVSKRIDIFRIDSLQYYWSA
jgi:hypothetical protein